MVEIGRHMPIGLAYLAAQLRTAGMEVEIFDSLAWTDDNHVVSPEDYTDADRAKLDAHPRWRHLVHWGATWERITDKLSSGGYDVVGVSCMFTPYYEPAYQLARLAREILPEARIVLGGQHPTVAHHHAMTEDAFDALVLGEAEANVADVFRALHAGESLLSQPGVAFRCGKGMCDCAEPGDRIHLQPRASFLQDLDSLPKPDVTLLDMSSYDATATLITSRGCPFSCSFCTVHATVGKQFRTRSSKNVADEIEHYVKEHGIRRFFVEDDNFTFDIDRVHEICRAIRDRDLDVELHLPNGMTVVKLDEQLVTDMAGAGFRSLFLGLETTDMARLRKIRKGFTSLRKVRDGAALFTEKGVDVGASLIVGLLGQSAEELVKDSVNLMLAGVRFWTNPFYPIPGSPDFQQCLANGLITHDTELALYDQFNFAIGSDQLSPAELYWSWVSTQAMAQWPAFMLEGAARRERGPVPLAEGLERLLAHSTDLFGPDGGLEVPAVPVIVDGDRVHVHPDGCYDAMQHIAGKPRPDDLCTFTGDALAAAVSLYTGVAHGSRQLPGKTEGRCVFALSVDDVDPVFERICRIAVTVLRESLDELADEPDSAVVVE
ncbi:B12-binding domain-containing radical SAM protein [Amycolatopsis aidingensis]|uniref:B12-binding domain-containing radical SAM protein n=1 Tax=Amycolatopsis aidingensis TaxID=2842453 RepID=UPI001C0C2337|nr:radical SAM protein [Amycolatopsis aidingensis]